jgi:hypothetical protein
MYRWLSGISGRGSDSAILGLHRRAETAGLRRLDFSSHVYRVEEATGLLCSGSLVLKRPEAQQGEPVRMTLTRHQLARAPALALSTAAAHETPMVEEEPQQVQILTAQVPTQCEVVTQS